MMAGGVLAQLAVEEIVFESLTDIGLTRKINQDSVGSLVTDGGLLLVVADGMGGHQGGETASRIAVESIVDTVRDSSAGPGEALLLAVEEANQRIYRESQRDDTLKGMGTTVVALFFQQDASLWVANVGDSRAYRCRRSKMERLTSDHSLVAEMQREGKLTEEEAFTHPKRNQLLRAVGIHQEVVVDISREDVLPGDVYMLCSDGLHGVLRDKELLEILELENRDKAASRFVRAAIERGGPDNVSVQVASVPGSFLDSAGFWARLLSREGSTAWKAAGAIFLGAILLGVALILWAEF